MCTSVKPRKSILQNNCRAQPLFLDKSPFVGLLLHLLLLFCDDFILQCTSLVLLHLLFLGYVMSYVSWACLNVERVFHLPVFDFGEFWRSWEGVLILCLDKGL